MSPVRHFECLSCGRVVPILFGAKPLRCICGHIEFKARRTILEQAQEAADLARLSFDTGDFVGGIAAITVAAGLVKLARIWERVDGR